MKSQVPPASRETALSTLKTAMIEKKLTQFQLADAADCHEKTIQNLLGGRSVRDQTLFDVCMVLGLDFDVVKADWLGMEPESASSAGAPAIAPLHMGGYVREAVDHYIGSYLTLRPDFTGGPNIIAFRTEVFWSDIASALCFREQNRPDDAYSHQGHLYIPSSSMFIHLVSLTKGAMRMVLISQLDQSNRMRGIITTLNKSLGSAFIPVAAPIMYEKRESFDGVSFGEIAPGMAAYDGYKSLLDPTLAQSYARIVGK